MSGGTVSSELAVERSARQLSIGRKTGGTEHFDGYPDVGRKVNVLLTGGQESWLGTPADRGYFDEGYVLLAVILAVVVLLALRLPGSAIS